MRDLRSAGGESPGTRRGLPTASSEGVGAYPNQPLSREPKHPLGVAEERRGVTQVANNNGERDYLREK